MSSQGPVSLDLLDFTDMDTALSDKPGETQQCQLQFLLGCGQ